MGTGPGEDIRGGLTKKCATMDRPVAALIRDLREAIIAVMLKVVWPSNTPISITVFGMPYC